MNAEHTRLDETPRKHANGWWIYWVGPMTGMLTAITVCSSLARRIEVAKLYHFANDRRRLFHRMAGAQ